MKGFASNVQIMSNYNTLASFQIQHTKKRNECASQKYRLKSIQWTAGIRGDNEPQPPFNS